MVLVLLVAGFFLLADLLLLVVLLFAAQSNLAFLGMWRCSTRPDLAELLPFDADAGSSSNMVSSQPGRPLGLQSWSGEIKKYIRRGASYSEGRWFSFLLVFSGFLWFSSGFLLVFFCFLRVFLQF